MPDYLQEKTDEELLEIYRLQGDKQVIGILFKRHSILCFAVCNKYLKNEDAAQDAVMQIFENLFTDITKHPIRNFRNWLHSVARNHCLMALRKPAFYQLVQETDEESSNHFMEKHLSVHPEESKEEMELKLQVMEDALKSLSEKQRLCVVLFYLEQNSYEQIGSKTGLTLNEVKSAIQNGKRNLKISLAEKGITYLMFWYIWI